MVRSFRSSFGLVLGVTSGLLCVCPAMATSPMPVTTFDLPAPDGNAFFTSFRYDNSSTLYAWNGLNIFKQAGDNSFASIGQVPSPNSSDTGPINFSQDGSQIIVGNGAGGNLGGSYAGEIFQLPKTGGNSGAAIATLPFSVDIVPVPASPSFTGSASKYFVDQGADAFGSSSSISIFDTNGLTNNTVISNIPGGSASIAINPANNELYAEVGFGTDAGQIRSFSLSALETETTPVDFGTGSLFDSVDTGPQSGAGLFFDSNGYLFSGGDGGITVFSPDGLIVYEQDPSGISYNALAYDPATNQVLEGPEEGNTAVLYNATDFESVPEPASLGLITLTGATLLGRGRRAKVIG